MSWRETVRVTGPFTAAPTVETARLHLIPAALAQLAQIAALHADERVWRHRPGGRHTNPEHTRSKVVAMEQQWRRDSLGYWSALLSKPIAGVPAGTFVGVGGCAVEAGAAWWNVYYCIHPDFQGHGFAAELCAAALLAAQSANAERPVIASLMESNGASKATAERTGLNLQWRGLDPGNSAAVRLIYADRPLDPQSLDLVVGHSWV